MGKRVNDHNANRTTGRAATYALCAVQIYVAVGTILCLPALKMGHSLGFHQCSARVHNLTSSKRWKKNVSQRQLRVSIIEL